MNSKDELKKYQFKTNVQLRYEEFDTYFHLNNVAYLSCFQRGRGFYIDEIAAKHSWVESPMVIASNLVNYFLPVYLNVKEVDIYVRFSAIGNKSITVDHLMVSKDPQTQENIIHSWCQCVLVRIDTKTRKAIPVDDYLRQVVEDSF